MNSTLSGTLSEQLYHVLRRKILAGEYPPGYHLREVSIAQEFQTSATPVREAIRRLTQEGLVETARYRGAVVKAYDLEEFLHLYQIREILEIPAAKLAITRVDTQSLADIEAIIVRSEKALEEHDADALMSLDLTFHELLVHASGNPVLSGISRGIHEKLQTIRKITIPVSIVGDLSHSEHKTIFADLKRRDVDAIEQHLTQHIRRNRSEVLSHLQNTDR